MSFASPIEIVVRRPQLAFELADPLWMPANLAFGYGLNAASLTLPYLEPYLIRVMKQAREVLGDLPPDLRREIDLFNGQEANHFKIHARYNAVLRERYEGIEAFEREIDADFDRMLREESLEWNLGYAAGFETTGLITAGIFFRAVPESRAGADPAVWDLWAWHLAEEYEHRCVAFEVFRAAGGTHRERIRMFHLQKKHLRGFSNRAAEYMREQDLRAGRIAPDAFISSAQQEVWQRQERFEQAREARALLPDHDPRLAEPLPEAGRYLDSLVEA
jgi:predicted metal-dependent hydrolase